MTDASCDSLSLNGDNFNIYHHAFRINFQLRSDIVSSVKVPSDTS